MSAEPLWTWADLVAASGAMPDGDASVPVTGFSLDTRTLAPGEVFVALKDVRDGHDFVGAAFARGAAAAIVAPSYDRKPGDGVLLRATQPLAALERIGAAARARLDGIARVVAVTGSVGKTGTKEMLRAVFAGQGATHAPEKSFNNHWGVPLTLARMPAATRWGVFEIGMNHADEIRPLTRLVRPHAAIITTVEAVHLENFASVEGIADAKAEILEGLEPGRGIAILNRDNAYFDRIARRAAELGIEVVSFGRGEGAAIRARSITVTDGGSRVDLDLAGRRLTYEIAAPGEHIAINSLAVAAALHVTGADVVHGLSALSRMAAPAGRGARHIVDVPGGTVLVIDESYNANPASMRAALQGLALVPRSRYPRRIAVLGDMLELGPRSDQLHAGLKEAIDAAGVDLVFACGQHMAALFHELPPARRALWAVNSPGINEQVLQTVQAGDAVMVKGSLGSRMGPIVEALATRLSAPTS